MFRPFQASRLYMLALLSLILWPTTLLAMRLDVAEADQRINFVQSDLFPIHSSHIFSASGPADCPSPAIFKHGTRTIFSYTPIVAKVDQAIAVAWYELDEERNVSSNRPFAVANGKLEAGDSYPYGSVSFGPDVTGNAGVVIWGNAGTGWVALASGAFRLAPSNESVPTPGPCPLKS